ncbi:MAG: DNA repair protein RecO [Cytophagaceae bacterium]|nr:DNA repair protein RecO [Cytophagaceae bacterium]MDW8456299.1 DNA repair protein RecO [Cytophagaceae bacterium]
MLLKTKSIALSYIDYRETSIIAKIYTEKLGLQSYIVNGVRNNKAKFKLALFQPLTLLDMVVYYKQGRNLNRISELKCYYPYRSIPYQQKKITIAFFIGEILSKTLREEVADENLFVFLENAMHMLDNCMTSYENFHLWFLVKLSGHLGFMPESVERVFKDAHVAGTEEDLHLMAQFMQEEYPIHISIKNDARRHILKALINYYKWHIPGMNEIHSVNILHEVLS